jgi:hypothetical protein
VSQGRHSLASRNARAQRLTFIAAPVLTCAVVGGGIAFAGGHGAGGHSPIDVAKQAGGSNATQADRTLPVSRSVVRAPVVDGKLWATADLDLRLKPSDTAKAHGELKSLRRVAVTGVRRAGFAQVVVAEKAYWVSAEYLARKKPTDPAHLPLIDKQCPGTSGVESGLQPGAIKVLRAVCNNFPQITQYGGRSSHGEHRTGKAIDIMTSDVTLGTEIADFLRAHAAELDLFDVIWRQHIWTPVRASEGWRSMSSRGSETANHDDHVHVSIN